MKKFLTYKGACMTWECDSNRHMNVMYYINKFEHAGHNTELELGLFDDDRDGSKGIVVVEQKINYYKEVLEDDLIYVESTLLDIGNKAFTILHEMYNGKTKELLSTMNAVLVLFDKINRKSLPFPEDRRKVLLSRIKE